METMIERLEKSLGPDRALDWEIHCRNGMLGVGPYGSHPPYTGSIDAALTLLPAQSSLESLGQFMSLGKDGQPIWQTKIRRRTYASPFDKGKRSDGITSTGFLPLPALALCVGALRAAAEIEKQKSQANA